MYEATPARCVICGDPARISVWCWEHFTRWTLTGDPKGEPRRFLAPPGSPGEWRPVAHYPNYLVSHRGLVWSRPRNTTTGGLMKLQDDPHGYAMVMLTGAGSQKQHRVHAVVLRAFVGPRPPGLLIRHLNGDPWDNRWPENICYGTYEENGADMVRHGRSWTANKTHCPQGHPYDEENTYIIPSTGGRLCRICMRRSARRGQAAYRARIRASGKQCSLDDCEDPPVAKGLCNRHWKQQHKARKAAAS